jgi:hypothetical protein
MAFFNLIDGGGSGRLATVSSFFRLNVSAKTNPRIFYSSRDEGKAFNSISTDVSATAGDYIWYIKNTSTTNNLYVKHLEFHSENAAVWKVWEVTGTASGTTIIESNLNLGSPNVSESLTIGDGAVTGLTTVKQVGTHRNGANGEGEMSYDNALILVPGSAIAVEYDSGTTGAAEIDCFYHFEEIDKK